MKKFKLIKIDNKLSIQVDNEKIKPLCVDFTSKKIIHRLQSPQKYQEPLIKAIGIKPNKSLTILDATAGLGRDGFMMAALGAKVILLERNNVIFQLLEDGIKRAKNNTNTKNNEKVTRNLINIQQTANNMYLIDGDSIKQIPTLSVKYKPDIIYLDPMFSDLKSKSLPQKEMSILRMVAKDDDMLDCNELLNIALSNVKKVVVKQHKSSGFLLNKKNTFKKCSKEKFYCCSR